MPGALFDDNRVWNAPSTGAVRASLVLQPPRVPSAASAAATRASVSAPIRTSARSAPRPSAAADGGLSSSEGALKYDAPRHSACSLLASGGPLHQWQFFCYSCPRLAAIIMGSPGCVSTSVSGIMCCQNGGPSIPTAGLNGGPIATPLTTFDWTDKKTDSRMKSLDLINDRKPTTAIRIPSEKPHHAPVCLSSGGENC